MSTKRFALCTAAIVAASTGVALWRWRGTSLDRNLATGEPCAAKGIEAEVLESGTPQQREKLRARLAECAQFEQQQLCVEVAADSSRAHFDERRAAQLSTLGDMGATTAEVYKAVAVRAPAVSQLKLAPADILCSDHLWTLLVETVSSDAAVWSIVVDVSDSMKLALRERGLEPAAGAALVHHADSVAKVSVAMKAQADALCTLVDDLHAGDAPHCRDRGKLVTHGPDSGAPAPLPDVPPSFVEAAEQRRADSAALTGCVLDCVRGRTPEQVASDEAEARASIERRRHCADKCSSDNVCLKDCLSSIRPSSVLSCQKECERRFPNGAKPPPLL